MNTQTKPICLRFANGQVAFECASRKQLIDTQCELKNLLGHQLFCGCRDDIQLRVILARANGNLFPKSWPNQRALHPDSCGTAGLETENAEPENTSTGHSIFERAFDEAYLSYWLAEGKNTDAFLESIRSCTRQRLSAFAAENIVGAGLFYNEPLESIKAGFERKLTVHISGTNKQEWPVGDSVSFRVRTDPAGHTLPGLHVIAGVYPSKGAITHLHAWPVCILSGCVYPLHSKFEETVLNSLVRAEIPTLKVPSEHFLKDWTGPCREAIVALAAERVWPDYICFLPDGRICVVEAAGLDNAAYRLRLMVKMDIFDRLELTHAIEWAVVRPVGNGFRIAYSSARLSVKKVLSGQMEGVS